ncbi:hypothetical protein H101_07494, partial [Trichophyton interdigitale H6]
MSLRGQPLLSSLLRQRSTTSDSFASITSFVTATSRRFKSTFPPPALAARCSARHALSKSSISLGRLPLQAQAQAPALSGYALKAHQLQAKSAFSTASSSKLVDVKKVLVIGSGGLSIGQAGEFDYSG